MKSTVLGLCLLAGLARAHGSAPQMHTIAVHPSDPARIALETTFGLVVTRNGGTSWEWICEEAIGINDNQHAAIHWLPGGELVAASYRGVYLSRDQGCSWTAASAFAD